METIEKKLQQLPQVKPNEVFVTHLEKVLVEKHVLVSREKKAKNFGILPVFTLGGFLILTIIICSGIIYKNYNLSTNTKNTVSRVSDIGQPEQRIQPGLGGADYDYNMPTKSAGSYSSQSINTYSGYLVESNSDSQLYELRNKEEITYYVSGDQVFLKLFVNKEVLVKGYLEGSFDNINIIKTAKIELK